MKTTTLDKIANIYNGNSINADYKKKHFAGLEIGYPFIATKDVSFNGEVDYNNGVKIPFETEYKTAEPGSVFICAEGGSAGRKIAYITEKVCFGNKLFCLQPKDGKYNGRYLYYYLMSDTFQTQFKLMLTGLIGGVSAKKFKSFTIPVLPIEDQEQIVTLLDDQFAKIDALKANAASQLQAAKDLFQSALKEMLTPKERWERKMLKEVSTIIGGSTPKTSDASNWVGNNNWVTPAELNGEKYYGKTKRTISDKAAKGMQLLPVGTILLSSRAPIGKVAITTEPMYCNQGFKNIVCSNVLYNEYVYWYILFSVPQLEALGVGATFKELSKSRTEEFPISFPSLSEQERIAARLDAISEKVKALQANYDQTITLCNDLKQALLKSIFA